MADRFQEGFDRIQTALAGVPDRVPFTAQMHEFVMARTCRSSRLYYSDPHRYVSGLLEITQEFELDVPSFGYDVYNVEAEALGHPLVFKERQSPVLDPALVLVSEPGDLLRLRPPAPGRGGRMPFVLEARRLYRERVGVVPAIQFCAPFSLAVLLRGYETFIHDLYVQPDFASDLLGFVTDQILAPWIEEQKKALPEADLAVGADALCSPPMSTPQIIADFSIPYIQRLRETCGVRVCVVNWWGESACSKPEELLELKRLVAYGTIRAQDPDVAKLGPALFKRYADAHDLSLELGIGDEVLDHGPPAAIRDRVRSYVAQAAQGGRLILYLCNVNADTPPAHLQAAVRAIKDLGRYPMRFP